MVGTDGVRMGANHGNTRLGMAIAMIAMLVIVVASNYLVQFPIESVTFFGAAFLTLGAFTYPVSFLVTELTNRIYGPAKARRVVYAGFAAAVAFSLILSLFGLITWRIAVASGTAFLVAQLLDITVFNRLRAFSWWRAPLVAGSVASAVDTTLFFTLAFAGEDFPWVTIAMGDFVFKLGMALLMLAPFRIVLWRALPKAA